MQLLEVVFHKALIWTFFFLLFPLFITISFLILILDGSPVFFTQKRVGKSGKFFTLLKFRTMIPNAENIKTQYQHLNEAKGPVFKIRNDPRFTSLGAFLSHVGCDEIPQLINILKGEMSLIGPRPLPVLEAKKLKKWQQARHSIKPGIISPWILNGYHENTFENWMKSDIEYAQKKNIIYDTQLLSKASVLLIKLFGIEIRGKLRSKRKSKRLPIQSKKTNYSVN